MVSSTINYRWRLRALNISFESGGSGSCGNWYESDAEGPKRQNITSPFSRSTNPQSRVTTNTSCNVSVVDPRENKAGVERVWVSLSLVRPSGGQRIIAASAGMWGGSSLSIVLFHNQKCFTSGPAWQTADLLKTPRVDVASSPQLGGVEPDKEAPYWAGLLFAAGGDSATKSQTAVGFDVYI